MNTGKKIKEAGYILSKDAQKLSLQTMLQLINKQARLCMTKSFAKKKKSMNRKPLKEEKTRSQKSTIWNYFKDS